MIFYELDTDDLQKSYNAHMKKLLGKYPKSLYNLFVKCERFHDYYLKSLALECDSILYKKQHDKIVITFFSDICGAEKYLKIEFSDIVHFEFNSDYYCKYGDYFIKTIYFSELNIVQDDIYSFEFVLSDGPRFYVEFKKSKVLENSQPKFWV